MPKYQVTTNEREYPVTAETLASLDHYSPADGQFHILQNGKSYHIELHDLDVEKKMVRLSVNGRPQEYSIGDETDQLVKKLGFSVVSAAKSKNVTAPMPGLVLDVLVAPGDVVAEGTTLLILEAMKMENVLKAEGEGTVTAISVAKGDAVEKRQLLIEIE